jgi:hypothetical protein
VRRDVTDGLPGYPLRLGVRVVDEECEAVRGAVVDIWHADVDGDYSAFSDGSGGGDDAGEGTTFLRGSQITTSADGGGGALGLVVLGIDPDAGSSAAGGAGGGAPGGPPPGG